jgi:D-galactarolactone cycloisomerase
LFGGQFRDKVRLYISSIWVNPSQLKPTLDATAHYVFQGFTAIKYHGWPEFGEDLERDSAVLRDLRASAGKGIELMLDLGRPPSLTAAIKWARMIEHSGADIGWWEEPLSTSDDLDNLAQLTARTDLTIAAGEGELTAFQFKELLAKRAVDLLQPDLSWVGGLTEGKRIAEIARLFNTPMIPHNWGTMVNFAASVQLVASMPQGFLCEYPITNRLFATSDPLTPSPMMTELAGRGITVDGGYALVPQTPGLGIELDEDAVGRHMRVS